MGARGMSPATGPEGRRTSLHGFKRMFSTHACCDAEKSGSLLGYPGKQKPAAAFPDPGIHFSREFHSIQYLDIHGAGRTKRNLRFRRPARASGGLTSP